MTLMSSRLELTPRRLLHDDHIIVRLRIGFTKQTELSFTENVVDLVNQISGQTLASNPTARSLRLKVISCDEDGGDESDANCGSIELAIPAAAAPSEHGLPLILAIASFGSVFAHVNEYQLLDIDFPDSHLRELPGPSLGADHVMARHGGKRVSLGLVLRPRFRADPALLSRYVRDFVREGIDYIV